ncbi:N-terminal C2 in EEIG1 and EHBP1 proteins-domain-containing protein [Halteromyces radiatus]|uniref:N-terminal C2 in EEIG1 and EHBP1 proteins-domain-containing protein n=1 Tax=Halteromyces radiatus TaxID=101107 RepID=UPI002220C31C|nr:N-terminal C2 in EEIG1 and EHBP1 proteins-domain-containing protein [Halteromyces radiatus]KAI8082957.1 N-terminal C2 in EEIG1 and EHBP1 proteins-domain-containing protein [Halteromyces radiatus]
MTPLTHLFISKHRKVHFDIAIVIRDLVNIPLVSGLFFVNWRMKNASQTYGATVRVPIKDHTVCWNQPIKVLSQMVINKQRVLGPCELKLEVFQELGGKQVSNIGDLTINLSEYVDAGLATERFLLNHSKFNSTLKLAIKLHQKSDPGVEFQIPIKKKQLSSSIPSFIIERKSSMTPSTDDRLLDTRKPTTNRVIRKSQSTMTLKYCRQNTLPKGYDCPSPQDVVEQLFAH